MQHHRRSDRKGEGEEGHEDHAARHAEHTRNRGRHNNNESKNGSHHGHHLICAFGAQILPKTGTYQISFGRILCELYSQA